MKALYTNIALAVVLCFAIFAATPVRASTAYEYGAWYYTQAPFYQPYYQPMYVFSQAPAQTTQSNNVYLSLPNSQQAYTVPSTYQPSYYGYNYGYPQNSYNAYPNYGYGYSYSQPSPFYGYPTGDQAPWIGGELCTFPDYPGRALCGSNPNQWIYDPWTGTWY